MNDTHNLPAPPEPAAVVWWAGQVRAVLPLAGGILGTLGIVLPVLTDAQISAYVGAVMVLIGIASYVWTAIWSSWDKYRAEREKRSAEVGAAVASADATERRGANTPVTVFVTPEGESNLAVRVSAREASAVEVPKVDADITPTPASKPQAVA